MAAVVFRLKNIPAGATANNYRIVIRGANDNNQGNQDLQDKSKQPVYGEAGLITAAPIDFVTNGIAITRFPYTMPDENTLHFAPYSVKEELARCIERNYIEVLLGGVVQTATQLRAF